MYETRSSPEYPVRGRNFKQGTVGKGGAAGKRLDETPVLKRKGKLSPSRKVRVC